MMLHMRAPCPRISRGSFPSAATSQNCRSPWLSSFGATALPSSGGAGATFGATALPYIFYINDVPKRVLQMETVV